MLAIKIAYILVSIRSTTQLFSSLKYYPTSVLRASDDALFFALLVSSIKQRIIDDLIY